MKGSGITSSGDDELTIVSGVSLSRSLLSSCFRSSTETRDIFAEYMVICLNCKYKNNFCMVLKPLSKSLKG
jgi:hypothetical protein